MSKTILFLIPCLTLFLIYKIFRSTKISYILKIIFGILLLIFASLAAVYIMIFGHFVEKTSSKAEHAIAKYELFLQNSSILPPLADLGNYTSIKHHHLFDSFFLFSSETDYFIFQYDSEEYKQQKDCLNKRYHFQETPIDFEEFSREPEVILGAYTFRMLSLDESTVPELDYPKSLFFIATNDTTHEIVYMYHKDIDLDYVTSTKELILRDAGWKYIR